MTPRDEAEALAREMWERLKKSFILHASEEAILTLLSTYLRQSRRDGLEEAAKLCDEREKFYSENTSGLDDKLRLARGMQRNEAEGCAVEIRQRAQEPQERTP